MLRDPDYFGASDAWLMFGLWMWVSGHPIVAAFSVTLCAVICVLPDPEPKGDGSGARQPDGEQQ